MTALYRTPLAHLHEAAGAKLVPFGGWDMPVQYEGILAEHEQTRTSAGLFDLSHMGRLRFDGPENLDLIQLATTNDAARLRVGVAQYSLVCNEQGGVIDDVLVYRLEDHYRLVVNASNRERVLAHFTTLRAREALDVVIQDETFETALLGLQGPASEDVLQPLVGSELSDLGYYRGRWDSIRLSAADAGKPALVSRNGYTGEDGFEIMVAAEDAAGLWELLGADQRVQPVGLGARDTLRLEAGMPLYGHELTEERNPFEAGLGRVVKLDKGPFVGRDALRKFAAEPPLEKLVGLTLDPGPVPRQGNEVAVGENTVGAVASGTFSPSLRRPIATAYVAAPVGHDDADLSVIIRGKASRAGIVSLPFVPHRTKIRGA